MFVVETSTSAGGRGEDRRVDNGFLDDVRKKRGVREETGGNGRRRSVFAERLTCSSWGSKDIVHSPRIRKRGVKTSNKHRRSLIKET